MRRLREAIGTAIGRPRRHDVLRLLPRGCVGAELGVFRGEFTPWILRITRPRVLHLVDAYWALYGERYPDWGAYTDHGSLTTAAAYAAVIAMLKRCDPERVATITVRDDISFLAGVPDAYFDWVYLDTTHQYEHTVEELDALRTKVRPGGLIAGDDWVTDPTHPHYGVARAVTRACVEYGWTLMRVDSYCQWCVRT